MNHLGETGHMHEADNIRHLPARLAYDQTPLAGTEHDDHPEILPATRGNFSEPYYDKMRTALALMPDLVEHLVAMTTTKTKDDQEYVKASKEAPLPFNATAFQDANTLFAIVAYFADMWSKRLETPYPGVVSRAWRDDEGRVMGLPASVEPVDARHATRSLTDWLTAHLESICWQHAPDVEFMHDELVITFTTAARWPTREKPHYSPMPCPTDGGIVGVFPAEEFGGQERYACNRCGREFETDEYQAYVRAYLHSRAINGTRHAKQELMLSERIKAQLMAKYGAMTRRVETS